MKVITFWIALCTIDGVRASLGGISWEEATKRLLTLSLAYYISLWFGGAL